MVIYRLTDRIPVKVGTVTFWLSPLSAEQKGNLLSLTSKAAGHEREESLKGAVLTIRYSLKKLEGVENADGTPYELQFGEDGLVTEESAIEVISLQASSKVIALALQWFIDRVKSPAEIVEQNPGIGETLDGVEVDFSKVVNLKKKE